MNAGNLFRAELARRGARWSVAGDGRWTIRTGGLQILVSLDNLDRQLAAGGPERETVEAFTTRVLAAAELPPVTADRLYWFVEPNDYDVLAEIRAPVSARLDRVLVHVTGDGALIRWITGAQLEQAGLTAADAAGVAWANLDRAVRQARVTTGEAAGAEVAMLATDLPSKASLLLAPGLRDAVEDVIGWPVLAIAPDRDFVLLWNAGRHDLIAAMGTVVHREYARTAYPLSMEVFEISNSIRAVGAYADSGNPPSS